MGPSKRQQPAPLTEGSGLLGFVWRNDEGPGIAGALLPKSVQAHVS